MTTVDLEVPTEKELDKPHGMSHLNAMSGGTTDREPRVFHVAKRRIW
jgi:hypothetical protein